MPNNRIKRRKNYRRKKSRPLLVAILTILFCVGLSLGLAALWQNSANISDPPQTSRIGESSADSSSAGQEESSAAESAEETDSLENTVSSAVEPVPLYYDFSKPVPESGRVTSSHFDDALFVGDSITAGIQAYALMKNASVVAFTGINTDTIMTRQVIRNDAGELETMPQAISRYTDVKKIYVMLGANGIAWIGKESFVENYGVFLDAIRQTNPDAEIYVQSILPVTAEKSQDPLYANSKIREYNAALQDMAEEKEFYYLNVAEAFVDEEGCLPEEASPTDGMHFGPKYYEIWFEYLKNHVPQQQEASAEEPDVYVQESPPQGAPAQEPQLYFRDILPQNDPDGQIRVYTQVPHSQKTFDGEAQSYVQDT